MKLDNVNKPTRPVWNKIQLASMAASVFMASYGGLTDNHTWMLIGGIFGLIGTVLPIFMK